MIFGLIELLLVLNILVVLFHFKLSKKYKQVKSDVSKILFALKSARYGNINIRVNEFYNKDVEVALNRLIETLYDRELMIKEYQNALSKKNLSLEEILKQEKQLQLFKEEFAATLTHDMKVPVIAELNSLNFLLDGRFGELTEKQLEILKLMKSSNQELKDLIDNMLETYKLDQRGIELVRTENNLNEFITNILNEMLPLFLKTQHNCDIDISETNEMILSFDIFQLKRVIKNIIQNALSFSPMGSNINVKTRIKDNIVQIQIANQGEAISEEDLDLIFSKYYSGYSKFKKAGTGLGLYLAQQIILAHNGEIKVDSSHNGYTTFLINLPVSQILDVD